MIGKNSRAVQGDVANLADLDRLYATIKAEKGALDIIVANAAFVEVVPTAFVTPEHFDKNLQHKCAWDILHRSKGVAASKERRFYRTRVFGRAPEGNSVLRYVLSDKGGHALVRPELGG